MAHPPFKDETYVFEGPTFQVDLPATDALHPIHYSRRLLIFRCDTDTQRNEQLGILKTAVAKLVQRCPLLGGIVAPPPSDEEKTSDPNWRTILPGEGLELIVKDLRDRLPSFLQFEATHFAIDKLPYDLLVPVPQDIGNDRPYPACKLQLSAIEGGSILTWAMSHSLGDGSSNNELIRILAEEARLAQEPPNAQKSTDHSPKSPIGLDRTLMRDLKSESPFQIQDHPGYMTNPPTHLPPHPFQPTSPELPVSLHLSATHLSHLKSDVQQPNSPPISTHDALAALIWRSSILIRSRRSPAARAIPSETIIHLYLPSDARRHLEIPDTYIGNTVYQLCTSIPLGDLIGPKGLQLAATALRATITAVTPAKPWSVLSQTNKEWVDWAFLRDYNSTGVAMGTDWTSFGLYEHDWGKVFGRNVVRFRYPGEEGTNVIFPKVGDGSADVAVAVMPDEVEVLRGEECFGKYLDD